MWCEMKWELHFKRRDINSKAAYKPRLIIIIIIATTITTTIIIKIYVCKHVPLLWIK